MKYLLTYMVCSIAIAQTSTTVNMPNSVTVSASATDALNKWLPTQTAATATTLNGAISSGATSITLASGAGIGANDAVIIDGEVFLASAKATATYTVAGAQFGTTAAAHANGATVTLLKYPTFRKFFLTLVNDTVAAVMENIGTVADSYNTAVTNAKATKAAAQSTAVQ